MVVILVSLKDRAPKELQGLAVFSSLHEEFTLNPFHATTPVTRTQYNLVTSPNFAMPRFVQDFAGSI